MKNEPIGSLESRLKPRHRRGTEASGGERDMQLKNGDNSKELSRPELGRVKRAQQGSRKEKAR